MKTQLIVIASLVLSILLTLSSCTLLIIFIKQGYTNFSSINGNLNVITLDGQCTSSYLIHSYGEALYLRIQIAFICSILSFALSICLSLLICSFVYRHHQTLNSIISQQTGNSSLQSFFNFMKQANDSFFQPKCRIITLYMLLAISVLSSYIPFKVYVQIWIDYIHSLCLINLNIDQIILIAIVSIITFSLSFFCFLLGLVINHHFYNWLQEEEHTSESYRHQMQRLIQEIPQSQRIMHQNGLNRNLVSQQHPKQDSSKLKVDKDQYNKKRFISQEEINQQKIQKVQSIIYQPQQYLSLQSVINPR